MPNKYFSSIKGLRANLLAVAAISVFASACAETDIIQPDAITVNSANNMYARERFAESVMIYRKASEENPDSPYRKQALLGLADSLYKSGDFFEGTLYYERFVELYPLDQYTPRALFYMGMCYYQDSGSADRDQTNALKAIEVFDRFIELYPDTTYTPHADKLKKELHKRQAESHFSIALFYYRLDKNIAAIGRLKEHLTDYPDSPRTAEALYLLGSCYEREEAFTTAAAIYTNLLDRYPGTAWGRKGIDAAERLTARHVN